MAKILPIQNSFIAGELSPRLWSRSDMNGFAAGLKTMENFVTLRQGPAAKRTGSRMVFTTDEASYGRIFAAQMSESVAAAVLVTKSNVYVFDDDGTATGANELINGNFSNGGASWSETTAHGGDAIFVSGTCGLLTVGGTPTSPSSAAVSQSVYGLTPSADYVLRVEAKPDQNGAKLHLQVYTDSGDLFNADLPVASEVTIPITMDSNPTATIVLSCVTSSGEHVYALDSVSFAELGAKGSVSFVSPWTTDEQVEHLKTAMPPSENNLYFVTPKVRPYRLIYSAGVWSFEAVTFTGAPSVWTGANWPSVVWFSQGRSWWGGTDGEPETFYGSQSGSILDLTTGSEDDDGLSFKVSLKGRIKWIAGARASLVIGTATSESLVVSSGGVITPSDIQVSVQSNYGSSDTQPLLVDNQVFFVTGDGAKLRNMGYQYAEDGWVGDDITFSAQHMADYGPLTDICYSKNPESILWGVRGGIVVGCTYDAKLGIAAWHKHYTDGYILSMSVVELGGTSYTWLLVSRTNANGKYLSVELFDIPDRLDSSVKMYEPSGISEVTIPHLAGKTVQAIIDGAVHPAFELDDTGYAELNYSGKSVVVGLPYMATLETMPVSISGRSGNMRPMQKRYNKLFVSLLDSALPKINGYRPADRTPSTPMDEAEPVLTELVSTYNEGWSNEATVKITQEIPLPTKILSIAGELSANML